LNQDPVIVAAQILVSLQQICSRYADPRIPTVLSFGKVIANGSANVIPESVQMDGTLRTFDDTWRAEAIQRIQDIVTTMAESFGLRAEIEIRHGYPSLINDPKLTQVLQNNAIALFGSENVLDVPLWTAAEDFAYYAQKYPASFYLIGTKNLDKGIYAELHTPTFQIDEEILTYGIKMMVQSVLSLFKSA
ncbi:MAG: M20 metallopeptidase family protein, partial [Sphingobacterium sp.]